MRLNIDHQTGFRYAARCKSSYNEARMTPAATRAPDDLEQPGQHRAGRLELQLHRLLGHPGHHLRAARGARAADGARAGRRRHPRRRAGLGHRAPGRAERPRLGRAARPRRHRPDGGVPHRQPADRAAAGAGRAGRRGGRPAAAAGRARRLPDPRRPAALRAGLDGGDQRRGRRLGPGHRRLPGLQPRRPGRAALDRAARPLRLGLPAPGTARAQPRRSPGESHSWVEWWCGTWVAYDPTRAGGSPTATSGSATAATTATSRRCAGPTRAARRRCSSPWR